MPSLVLVACALIFHAAVGATDVLTLEDGLGGFQASPSCKYTKDYGAHASPWGSVQRGGWRGAVLGPGGDKIYGIPTNATQVFRARRPVPTGERSACDA